MASEGKHKWQACGRLCLTRTLPLPGAYVQTRPGKSRMKQREQGGHGAWVVTEEYKASAYRDNGKESPLKCASQTRL